MGCTSLVRLLDTCEPEVGEDPEGDHCKDLPASTTSLSPPSVLTRKSAVGTLSVTLTITNRSSSLNEFPTTVDTEGKAILFEGGTRQVDEVIPERTIPTNTSKIMNGNEAKKEKNLIFFHERGQSTRFQVFCSLRLIRYFRGKTR